MVVDWLPEALAAPVLMVAVPVELLVGLPRLTLSPMRPPEAVWLIDWVLVELLPMAVLLPVEATASPLLLTVAVWPLGRR